MANYQSRAQVTIANRAAAYKAISSFFLHLDPLDVTLLSLTYNATTKRVDIVTASAIPPGQLEHLGIEAS